jgi:hypothetical protein
MNVLLIAEFCASVTDETNHALGAQLLQSAHG